MRWLPTHLLSLIAQIDELKGQWIGGAQLNAQALGRLKRSTLITSAGASTRIEGARLSDEDIEKFLRGLSIKKFRSRDIQEVRGYYELLEKMFNSWKSLRFSESMIKSFHKELLKYVEKDQRHRGEYKKGENRVVARDRDGNETIIFDPTPAYLTPKEMQELVEWTITALREKRYHPLLIIGNFVVEFLKIHPFQDGNGRLSRILTNFLLLKSGYEYMPYVSHEKFVENNKTEYYIVLRRSQKSFKTKRETIVPWLAFFFTLLRAQAKMAIELLSKESIDKLLSNKQRTVLACIEERGETSVKDIVKKTKISRATVKQALDVLLRLRQIARIGQGRSTYYRKL